MQDTDGLFVCHLIYKREGKKRKVFVNAGKGENLFADFGFGSSGHSVQGVGQDSAVGGRTTESLHVKRTNRYGEDQVPRF